MPEFAKDYKIIRKINLLKHEPEYLQPDKARIYIVKIDDKYGMIDHTGAEILPAEYDNIFHVEGSYIYILIKDGKMGLLEYDVYLDSPVTCRTIKKEVPCEYDYIDTQYQRLDCFYILYKNTEAGELFQLYMPFGYGLTEEFKDLRFLDEGYVELLKENTRRVIDSDGGTLLTDNNRYMTVKAYGTNAGRVLYDRYEKHNGRLFFEIFTEEMLDIEHKVVEFEGKLEVVFSTESVLGSERGIEPVAVAFKITDKNGNVRTLNAKAEYID